MSSAGDFMERRGWRRGVSDEVGRELRRDRREVVVELDLLELVRRDRRVVGFDVFVEVVEEGVGRAISV